MKLTDVCELNPKTEVIDDNTLVSFVAMPDVSEDGKIRVDTLRTYGEVKKGYTGFKEGDILFAKITPCMENGKGALATGLKNGIGYGSTEFHIIRPDSAIVLGQWLYYLTSWSVFRKEAERHMTGSAGQKRVPKSFLEKYEVDVPSIDEQKHQVLQLDCVRKIIDAKQHQLLAYDDLIKARFVELFGDININSKNWPILPLGDLCTIVRGGSPRPIEQFLGGDIPWIKIGDATEGESIYLTSTKEHIIQEGVKKSRLVKAGSLIFANCGVSLGFARIITFDGCIHDGWLAMEDIDERLDKIFLLQTLNQMTEHFRKMAPAGTQPNLNTAIMKAYQQIIPPMNLQKEFITFLEKIDKSKSAIQKSLDETQFLFDSLMQQYFG